jgi:hypothetical protein
VTAQPGKLEGPFHRSRPPLAHAHAPRRGLASLRSRP